MMSEEEERPRFVTGGYGRHRCQWVDKKPLKSKFFRISGVFGLSLERFFKFITKGPIFWKMGSRD